MGKLMKMGLLAIYIIATHIGIAFGETITTPEKELHRTGKIVYADFFTIYHSYYRTEEENKRLEEKGREIQKKIDSMIKEVEELEKRRDSGIISEEEKKTLSEKINEARLRVNMAIENYGLQMDSERRKTIDKLIEELRLKITQFGKEKGYAFIVDTRGLLFADANLDVTKEIIEYVNKKE